MRYPMSVFAGCQSILVDAPRFVKGRFPIQPRIIKHYQTYSCVDYTYKAQRLRKISRAPKGVIFNWHLAILAELH